MARTICDLAAKLHPRRLERLVDSVAARSPKALSTLRGVHAELAHCGRNGSTRLRTILEARPAGYVPPESGLEARFISLLAGAGEPPLDRQIDLGGHEWMVRRVHLARAQLRAAS